MERITAFIPDFQKKLFFPGTVFIEGDRIIEIAASKQHQSTPRQYILPGFIDSHVHIESSLLVPTEFARLAVVHGTVASVSDPHEIANVCGEEGVQFMIENGKKVPFKFHFGAPSCVPATSFETAGAELDENVIRRLLTQDDIHYLSEMMNYPGVLNDDPEILQKIAVAKSLGKPVDGHAPGLRAAAARKYAGAGISTDHECFTLEEALDKLHAGMKIIIREGSAARNFDTLICLLNDYPEMIMFCSDDKHPDSLYAGHINDLCARAVATGIDIFSVIKAASLNPIDHYQLNVGRLLPGDPADFVLVKNLQSFEVLATYIDGQCVAKNGKSRLEYIRPVLLNNFYCQPKKTTDFHYPREKYNSPTVPVIEALDGQLITRRLDLDTHLLVSKKDNLLHSNPDYDILKMVVVNRYRDAEIAKAFVKNFGLKNAAIASSVAHDSHNIVAVGSDDKCLCEAVNMIIESKGGLSLVQKECADQPAKQMMLPLPVAGLMSDQDGYKVVRAYTDLDQAAKAAGSTLNAPFMTLSFMALLVIPHLKISDQGLFDVDRFEFIDQLV